MNAPSSCNHPGCGRCRSRSDREGSPPGEGIEILETHFFALDLLIGFSLPIFLYLRHRSDPDGGDVLRLFWIGVAVGLTWEIPIFVSALVATDPVVTFLREPPLHPIVFLVAHAFWDGGLFLAGIALVQALCAPPILQRFRWQELAVLLAWGQASEFAVEAVSILNQGWVYSDSHRWNPVLFHLADHPITLLPQLIWLAAPIVYYGILLELGRRRRVAR